MNPFLVSIILGLVEGITEFLPISSTGHLIIAENLLGFKDSNDVYTVVIQLGAIGAVVWFYRLDLWKKVTGLFKREQAALTFWKVLAIATIPAGLAGLALDKSLEQLSSLAVIAWALILGGIILWLVDRKPRKVLSTEVAVEKVSFKQALLVGLGQCVAIIPGVSRSGATIVSGLAVGLDRPTATAFSFYLSIPVLILASGYKIVKHPDAIASISGGPAALFVGIATAFVAAFFSIGWLLRYVSRHDFKPFAYYRIVLGTVILIVLAVN